MLCRFQRPRWCVVAGFAEAALDIALACNGMQWHARIGMQGLVSSGMQGFGMQATSSTPWPRGRADCLRFANPAEALRALEVWRLGKVWKGLERLGGMEDWGKGKSGLENGCLGAGKLVSGRPK